MFILLIVVVFSLIFLHLQKHNKHENEKYSHPPGPKGLPIIGNFHQFDQTAPHVYLQKLAKIHGPISYLRFGRVPVVVIQSAKLAKEVMKTQDQNFCSRPSLVGMHKFSYGGLDMAFTPYNAYFREIRKIGVVHLFSSKRVQSFAPIRQDEISRMMEKISSLASTSQPINLSDSLIALTRSIICRIAFGKRYDSEEKQGSRFHNLMHEVGAMLTAATFSDYFPMMGWLDKLTGHSSRLESVFNKMDEFYEEIINEHIIHQDKDQSTRKQDIIDVLLQLQKERGFAFELTLDNIKAVLMNIIIAGTNTSALMIIWGMTELIKNPTIMKKCQEELRTKIQDKSFIEVNDLPKLEYLKAMVKETFRLHPAAPLLIVRETVQKCRVEGYDILPKTLVYVNAWAIGRDPESWKDPEIFMPERFIGSSVDVKGQDFELIPFGAGRRICPGMSLGLANVELTLANLLYSFNWELPHGMSKEDVDTDVIPGISMHKKNPLCLVPKKFL